MKLKFLILLSLLLISVGAYTQISAPLSDFSEATKYSTNDLVFVFCTEDVNGGSLTVTDSTGLGGCNFEWYKFNEGDVDFTEVLTGFTVGTGNISSSITGLTTGGYKIRLTNISPVQTYVAWVFNNVGRTVEIKLDPNSDCDYLWMETVPYLQRNQVLTTNLNYYDTIKGEYTPFQNKIIQYNWSANPYEDDFRNNNAPFATIVEDGLDNETELPTQNTIFSVTVTDRFGCIVEDDMNYTAIETDANFTWASINDKTGEELDSGDGDNSLTGPAPLLVKFTNESENGVSYQWFFGDTLWTNDIDTLKTTDKLLSPEHTYYYVFPTDTGKTYTMKLYSESSYGCKDSIYFNINMLPFKLELPNVFSPNSDGINDVFKVKDNYQSIRNFKITIFNRVGQLIHEFDGDIRDWEGWEGKVRDSGRDAPEGNYFFVVEVSGWDNKNYNNKNLLDSATKTEGGEDTPQTQGESKQFGVIRLFRAY